MKKRIITIAVVSALGLGGAATFAIAPALAADSTTKASKRLTEIQDALKSLVSDGTITQAQADKVATKLDTALPKGRGPGGPGGPGGRDGGPGKVGMALDAAATIIGITEGELRTQLRDGKTLAQIAATKNISKDTLISKLVAAAEAKLAEAVKAGKITQAQADERKADLKDRITEAVDRVGPGPRGGGHGGPGRGFPGGANPEASAPTRAG